MSYFPAFIDLQEEKKILIVGGGKTALHKVKVLLPFNVSIDVVAIFMNEELVELGKKEEKLTLYKKSFYDEMISPDVYHLVIAATNNRVVNHRISTLCKAEKLLVNVVDDPEECTFIFPSIVKRGDIICGISSSGTCPPVTQYIKEKLYDLLPDNIGDITEHLGILREQMKEDIPDHKQRSATLKNELEKELSASKILRIGTRGSALALRQTNIIIDRIKQDYPDMDIEVVKISTKGDRVTDRALAEIGGKGVFVEEIEHRLLSGDIDIAVHSGKDVPSDIDEHFALSIITPRANPLDIILVRKDVIMKDQQLTIDNMKTVLSGKLIGTSSPRREEMIRRFVPDCRTRMLRGNVPTRLDKLRNGEYDAIILAAAGIERLGADLSDFIVLTPSASQFVPAAAQGIIACETCVNSKAYDLLQDLKDEEVQRVFDIERALLLSLDADCKDAVGAHAQVEGDKINVFAFFGKTEIFKVELHEEDTHEKLKELSKKLKTFVFIVGAGPGNPQYMTIKAQEILENCDVIIYDSLIDDSLLKKCKANCELLYAGKRAGLHSMKQDDINELIIKKAREGKTVLRLKGGDPFVFGRGPEECDALTRAGIPYELVPGVTSATAVPLSAGIPVTYRKEKNFPIGSRAFLVVTGHTAAHTVEGIDFNVLSQFDGTIVFLMGLSGLKIIAKRLIECGKKKETPVAIICNGTLEKQHVLRGTLEDIAFKASQDEKVVSPGIIVVGSAASYDLRDVRSWYEDYNEKFKHKIAVTGTNYFCRRMAKGLKSYPVQVTRVPHMMIEPLKDQVEKIKQLDFSHYSHIVFTGKNAIQIFFDAILEAKKDIRILNQVRIAAIGKETADYLYNHYHIRADIVPDEYNSHALGEKIIEDIKSHLHDSRVLIPRAKKGNNVLSDLLKEKGIDFDEISIYDTICNKEALSMFKEKDYDFITFSSAEGVHAFFTHGGDIGTAIPVCIGDYTAKALRQYGKTNYLLADKATVEGLIEIIAAHL